tara:strand:- start:75 stop:860 length:786 start_codon:yes stop_codon:yes gene_type:complete
MVFAKGDKVSFLNEALKGIVIDYINDSHVLVEVNGLEMDVSANELIRITFIPKVDGKHLFPIKKEDRKIDELPKLDRDSYAVKKLAVGDSVCFMSDNTKGKIVAVNTPNEFEVELEDGFSIPANRLEIEKIWLEDFSVNPKEIQGKIKTDLSKIKGLSSTPHQSAPKYFQHNEVDLHMESIMDSCKGLSNFEIVTIQLNHFRSRLHEALQDNEPYLVVIHGIGKGVLKQEIYNYLMQFPNLKVGPADAKLYGMGASEIRIY